MSRKIDKNGIITVKKKKTIIRKCVVGAASFCPEDHMFQIYCNFSKNKQNQITRWYKPFAFPRWKKNWNNKLGPTQFEIQTNTQNDEKVKPIKIN